MKRTNSGITKSAHPVIKVMITAIKANLATVVEMNRIVSMTAIMIVTMTRGINVRAIAIEEVEMITRNVTSKMTALDHLVTPNIVTPGQTSVRQDKENVATIVIAPVAMIAIPANTRTVLLQSHRLVDLTNPKGQIRETTVTTHRGKTHLQIALPCPMTQGKC